MAKIILCLLIFMSFAPRLEASEKAFNILLRHGLNANDLVGVVKEYPELKDFGVTTDSEEISHRDSNSITIKFYSDKTNEAFVISKSANGLEIEKISSVFEVEVKTIEGSIYHTLYDSIKHEIHSKEIATAVSDAFKDEFTTSKGLKTKALYRFQVEQYLDEGKFVRYGNVLSASLIIGEAITTKTYRLNSENFSWGLFPENSGNVERLFYLPVPSEKVTSGFQMNRRHPVTKRHQAHKGIDLKAPNGSPIFPAMEGEVITISRTRSKGKYVTIQHDNGYQTTYIHLKKFAAHLKVGMWVDLEDQIGEVGRTGYSTGAHLHFGVIQEDGLFVNPIYLLKGYTYKEKGQHLDVDLSVEEKNPISDELIEDEAEGLE